MPPVRDTLVLGVLVWNGGAIVELVRATQAIGCFADFCRTRLAGQAQRAHFCFRDCRWLGQRLSTLCVLPPI
jgi:hypothetical protein